MVAPVVRCPRILLAAWVFSSACGGLDGSDSGPRAQYAVFDFKVTSPLPGQPLVPGQELVYELIYRGALADPPRITAVLTHETSGATARRSLAVSPSQQDNVFTIKNRWFVRDDFLKKSGTFHLHLEASITATLKGSQPWVMQSSPIAFNLNTTLDAIRLVAPAGLDPIPYGTATELQVDGHDLWDDVVVTAIDTAGVAIPDLQTTLPFRAPETTRRLAWILSARALEFVGSHAVQLVARFGDISITSRPVTLLLTHTVDNVLVFVRDQAGQMHTAGSAKLPDVKDIVVRARGTLLAGHEVTLNGGAPFMATADEIEVVRVPSDKDFASGKGSHTYAFTFRSGGVERTGSVDIKRWGILTCGWFAADGAAIADKAEVQEGTPVVMRATTWGFPDTQTTLAIFKDREATFQIWESDSGRHQLLGPGDDDVDSFDADILGDKSEKAWTAQFVEETGVPLIPVAIHAELYFSVKIEDQSCTSLEMQVPDVNTSKP